MSEVGKALAVAGEAARKALVKPPCCMEGTGCEMPPCHCSQVAASAAVAAFLRALPYHLILADTGDRPVCSGAHWLAAAVEAEVARDTAEHVVSVTITGGPVQTMALPKPVTIPPGAYTSEDICRLLRNDNAE